jgi:S1-C subfamily serine protease
MLYSSLAKRLFHGCLLCFFLCVVLLLQAPSEAFGQGETQDKDIWDKLSAISGLVSGIAVAVIGAVATYIYNERQRKAEDNRTSRDLAVQRVQTVQTFLPHLASQNEQEKKAALLAIGHLDDAKLASELAALFGGAGAAGALAEIATRANQEDAEFARRSLAQLFDLLRLSVVQVDARESPEASYESGGLSSASGFVARSDGLIATVSLIVVRDREYSVLFHDETSHRKAQLVKNFPELNIALLKVEGQTFHALPIEESLPGVGAEVFALSSPLTQQGWAPVVGRVVGISQELDEGAQEQTFIEAQLQGNVRAGFAGMPTVNSEGRVVGLGYASARLNGPGEATSLLIPAANTIRAIASI